MILIFNYNLISMIKKFINFIKKTNRKRNYWTKDIKLCVKSFKLRRSKLDLLQVKKITIQSCKNGLGDAIIISGLPKILKKYGYHISILTLESNSFLFKDNPNIDEIICVDKKLTIAQIKKLKSLECDLFIDPNNKTSYSYWIFKLIKLIKPKHTIGINYPKYFRIYDSIIEYKEYHSHITKRFIYILKKLNIDISEKNYHYDIHYPKKYDIEIKKFLANYENQLICIFNPYASSERRSFSLKQIQEIIINCSKFSNLTTIIVGSAKKISLISAGEKENIIFNKLEHFFYTIALIKHCDLVISVDTSIVHIANAYNKPLISVYSSEIDNLNPKYENDYVYKPNYDKAIQIIAPNKAAKNLDIHIINDYLTNLLNSIKLKN